MEDKISFNSDGSIRKKIIGWKKSQDSGSVSSPVIPVRNLLQDQEESKEERKQEARSDA